MIENPTDAFAEPARIVADQAQEIDPAATPTRETDEQFEADQAQEIDVATPAREPDEQFGADQAQEIDGADDEPIEPGDLPREGGRDRARAPASTS